MVFEIIMHYLLYFLFMMLVHMRYHTEIVCWHIDNSAEWTETPTELIFSQPWYFRIADRPAKLTWSYINYLMRCIEAVHPHICHPENFALPQVSYYNLVFDYNLN